MLRCALISLCLSTALAVEYPDTRRDDTVDTLHGTEVPDPYRWLEDDNSDETAAWVAAQNKVTRTYLDAIPARDRIEKRLTELWDYERIGTPYRVGDRYFFSRNSGLQNQSVLYTTESLDGQPRVLLDPNTLSEDGTVALSGLSISDDGELLAYSISRSGSDWKEWKVRDVGTGDDLADHIEWSKFSGASWSADNRGFYYSRYDEPKDGDQFSAANFFHKVYFHKVGTEQSEDRLVYHRPDQKKWNLNARETDDGRFLILEASDGAASDNAYFYQRLGDEPSEILPLLPDFTGQHWFIGNEGDTLWFRTDVDAPRGRVVAIDINAPQPENWRELIPQSEDTLRDTDLIADQFVATYMHDAHSRVKRFSLEGAPLGEVALPGIGSAGGFRGKREHRETFYAFESFTTPDTIYRYDFGRNESTLYRAPKLQFDTGQFETKQIFYPSKDGTEIPMFIVAKKGIKLDGTNPTLLYGYGGFDISLLPRFSTSNIAWLEMGGVYALANLRGGGEYGEEWHEAGMLMKKQNVFDDFIAAAEWLIAENYTSSEKLAIAGGSNGGLLVGACMTQRPDLYKACLPAVGVMDMLRYHKFTIGWAWATEYGSADDSKEMFDYLHGYSPLHNLKPRTNYPATMVTTGDHDDRVVPAHSFKFAAALQHAHASASPVLIRIETKAGHGAGKPTDKVIAEAADKWAFLAKELGVEVVAGLAIDALTFNIRYDNPKDGENAWPKRKAMVGEWLATQLPDVVGLQEAKRHQIDDLMEAVPAYAEYGVGRDDGKSKGEHCTILYKADRFEPGEGGTFWLSDTPEKIASTSWGNEIPRICTWLHLTDKTTRRSFYVYNTHWDHRSQPSRERAAGLIAKRILEREVTADPIILMGDFNAAEDNPAIATLKKHFIDTFRVAAPDEKFVRTFNSFKAGKHEGGKIDHVFILPDTAKVTAAAIERYHIDGRTLSDHYPVRARLVFGSPAGDAPSSP